MKKKAIKVATASAIAASAFVAAAPAQTDAASNVAVEVSKAVTQMKKAYHTYSDVTATGEFADINVVYKEYNAAKAAYKKAKEVVKATGGSTQAAYDAQLDVTYNDYIAKRVVTYIDAYNYATTLDGMRQDLEDALEAKEWDQAEELYHAISYELKTRTVILHRVYGVTARELLVEAFKLEAQDLRDSIQNEVSVKIYFEKADALVKEGKLTEAKAAMDKVAGLVAGLDSDTDFGAALLAKVAEVKAAYEAKLTPTVQSVKSLNANQIVIEFNKAIDASTVVETNGAMKNIVITGTGSPTFKGSLSADKKTLVLSANKGLTGEYVVNIDGNKVKSTDGKFVASFVSKVVVSDTVAPSVTEVERLNPTSLKVHFSEPLANQGNVSFKYADGSTVVDAKFDLDASGLFATIDLSDADVVAKKDIVVQIIGAYDFADNLLSPNPATVVVQKGEKDGVAPTVTSLNVLAPNQLEIKFSEEVSGLEVGDITGVTVSKVEKSKTDLTKYVLTLSAPQEGVKQVTLTAATVKDLSGETNAQYTKLVEFTKDTKAPELSSVQVTKDAKDGKEYLVFNFSKSVSLKDTDAITLSGSKVKDYITTNGITVTIPDDKLVAVEGSTSSFKVALADLLDGSGALVEGAVYTLDLPAGLVQNVSNVANAAKADAITFTRGKDTAPNATAQTVSSVLKGSGNSTVVVTFGKDVDGATATNVANYRIDGAVVEKAEILNSSAKNVVTLTLKDDSVTFTGLRNYSVVGVKAADGGSLETTARGTVNLTENVSPTVTKATITSPTTIELTFSETVKDGATLGNDFDVFQGTSTTALSETSEVINGNKVVVTLSNALTSLNGVVVKASSAIDVQDSNNNVIDFKQISAN